MKTFALALTLLLLLAPAALAQGQVPPNCGCSWPNECTCAPGTCQCADCWCLRWWNQYHVYGPCLGQPVSITTPAALSEWTAPDRSGWRRHKSGWYYHGSGWWYRSGVYYPPRQAQPVYYQPAAYAVPSFRGGGGGGRGGC